MKLRFFVLLFAGMAALLATCEAPTFSGSVIATETGGMPPLSQEPPTSPAENDAPIPFPGDTPVLVWHREGGIAGFCDDLSVNADGSFTVTTCVALPENEKTGQLDAGQLLQLTHWVNRFQSFDTSQGQDATIPDAMILKITFKGAGTSQAGPEDMTAINTFASLLVSPPIPVGAGGDPQAVSKARDFLAGELSIPVDDIDVVSFEFVEWPDRCMGVIVMGQLCAQGVTPGYKIILQAQGQLYELHTDESGERIRQAQ